MRKIYSSRQKAKSPSFPNQKTTQDSPKILRLLFGVSSEKIPFFRSRPEEDPNMIRRNGFSNRSKPVKISQNRSSYSQVSEIGKFCNTFVLLTNKNAQNGTNNKRNPWRIFRKSRDYCRRKLARTGHYQKHSQAKLETAHQ